MEVKLDYAIKAQCHPKDVWEKFCDIESWKHHTEIFGEAGWVHGKPWAHHSRFFIEMIKPEREDFEVVVLRSSRAYEIVLLSHGGGLAGEQWISVTNGESERETIIRSTIAVVGATEEEAPKLKSRLQTIMKYWFGGLAAEAERHCEYVAL